MNEKIITIKASAQGSTMLRSFIEADTSSYLKEGQFEPTRQSLLSGKPTPFPEVPTKTKLEKESCGGFDVYTFSAGSYENLVLYLHGGAFTFDIFPDHVRFCDDLVGKLNAKVYLPKYPLAPAYSYQDTYQMVTELYDELVKQNKPIFVMGDSAGGTLTLGLTDIIKNTGRKMPDRIIPICPAADLSFSNPEAKEVEKRDPIDAIYGVTECTKMWAKGTDLKDPALTALSRDVCGYPKTMLVCASEDLLTPDILLLYNKLKKAGNDVTLVRGEGLWHVFCVAEIPEKQQMLDIIADFCLN